MIFQYTNPPDFVSYLLCYFEFSCLFFAAVPFWGPLSFFVCVIHHYILWLRFKVIQKLPCGHRVGGILNTGPRNSGMGPPHPAG